jgi:hypothetical protein
MRQTTVSLIAACVVVVLMASSASAACVQLDLAGTWRVYVNGASADGGFWTWCRVTVNASGAVAAGGICRNSDGEVDTVTGGQFDVASPSVCMVTGNLIRSRTGTHTIHDSALDRSKEVLTGVGKDADESPWTFTAVKR